MKNITEKDIAKDILIASIHARQMSRIWELMGNDPMDELADMTQDAPDEMDEAHKDMEREALLTE